MPFIGAGIKLAQGLYGKAKLEDRIRKLQELADVDPSTLVPEDLRDLARLKLDAATHMNEGRDWRSEAQLLSQFEKLRTKEIAMSVERLQDPKLVFDELVKITALVDRYAQASGNEIQRVKEGGEAVSREIGTRLDSESAKLDNVAAAVRQAETRLVELRSETLERNEVMLKTLGSTQRELAEVKADVARLHEAINKLSYAAYGLLVAVPIALVYLFLR